MKTQTRATLFNALIYQFGWYGCMLQPETLIAPACAILIILVHLHFAKLRGRELLFIGVITLLGYGMDLLIGHFGWIDLAFTTSNTFYLFYLWLLFVTALRVSLRFVLKSPKKAFFIGATAPAVYVIGEQFDRVLYSRPLWQPLLLHCLGWGLVILIAYYLQQRLFRESPSSN